ncbi:hypothetical protein GCM10011297_00690 [Bacterioplanes sanyensis]|nr:hypothetical protein GCM10011297_00690 [Bacterioplanes sanyensis]
MSAAINDSCDLLRRGKLRRKTALRAGVGRAGMGAGMGVSFVFQIIEPVLVVVTT